MHSIGKHFLEGMALSLLLSVSLPLAAQQVADFRLPTPWSEDAIMAEVPLNEYPRPQMVREQWLNLNGW